jgi:hypothetical protein
VDPPAAVRRLAAALLGRTARDGRAGGAGQLQWDVNLTASRISGTWTGADLTQIQANFIAAAKSSYTKYRAP